VVSSSSSVHSSCRLMPTPLYLRRVLRRDLRRASSTTGVYATVYSCVMAGNPSRVLLDRPARRESILLAAATAFAQSGFAATSMDDVAAEAGITRLILYRHFDSKEALYTAVLERVRDRLEEESRVEIEGRRAISAIRALLVVGRENPAALVLLWRHASREP